MPKAVLSMQMSETKIKNEPRDPEWRNGDDAGKDVASN
jgi:hypothetical protein